MGKKDHLPLENLDLNSNTQKTEECFLYDLIDISLKSGRTLFFGLSYSVVPSQICGTDFVVRNHRRYQTFLRLLHVFFLLYMIIPFWTEGMYLSTCCLINIIKKGLHVVIVFCVLVSYHCLEVKGRGLVGGIPGILRQCVQLQNKFKAVGLHFSSKTKIRVLGWTISLGSCVICLIRQYMFTTKHDPWYERHSRFFARTISLGFWTPSNETSSESVRVVLGVAGVVIDGLIANYWYFVQIIHFTFALTMWIVLNTFNRGIKSGFFTEKSIPQVVDLHFQCTKLLKLMNQLISPLTFWTIVFDITCLCFWTNYIVMDFRIRPIYIAAVCFYVKTAVELILIADVNAKAHDICEWLEDCCTTSDTFPPMDPMKLSVFTSQIYNKESTGFKGLNFFVVTSHLVLAVGGIVGTYTVAVNQLCKLSGQR